MFNQADRMGGAGAQSNRSLHHFLARGPPPFLPHGVFLYFFWGRLAKSAFSHARLPLSHPPASLSSVAREIQPQAAASLAPRACQQLQRPGPAPHGLAGRHRAAQGPHRGRRQLLAHGSRRGAGVFKGGNAGKPGGKTEQGWLEGLG